MLQSHFHTKFLILRIVSKTLSTTTTGTSIESCLKSLAVKRYAYKFAYDAASEQEEFEHECELSAGVQRCDHVSRSHLMTTARNLIKNRIKAGNAVIGVGCYSAALTATDLTRLSKLVIQLQILGLTFIMM